MNVYKKSVSVLIGLSLIPLVGLGHHSFPEYYNTSQIAEIEGEITEVQWRNPHVHFTVKTGGGETWQIESNSVGGLERRELSQATIRVGTHVRVAGFPARNGNNDIYSSHLLLPDGREVLLRPGVELRWSAAPGA